MLIQDVPTRKYLPTLERREPLIMDHSATKIFKECPRKYFYRMVCGFVQENPQLKVIFGWGNAIHKFEELAYQGLPFTKCLEGALLRYVSPEHTNKWSYLTVGKLAENCKILYEHAQKELASGMIEIKGVEQPFNATLPDGTQIGGRIDLLFTRMGRLVVRDYKTTSKQTQYFQLTLNPNDQATRYAYAASVLAGWSHDNLNAKVDGIEFLVIENQAPTKKDNRTPKLTTIMVGKSAHDLLGWEQDQIQVYKMMALCREMDVWPMHENHCDWCDYAHVCRQPTDASKEWKLKQEFEVKFWDHQKVEQTKEGVSV